VDEFVAHTVDVLTATFVVEVIPDTQFEEKAAPKLIPPVAIPRPAIEPQHARLLVRLMMQTPLGPPSMALAVRSVPLSCGVTGVCVVKSPVASVGYVFGEGFPVSYPISFAESPPQHLTLDADTIAHVAYLVAAIAVTAVTPERFTDTGVLLDVPPSPNWPRVPSPQHFIAPPATSAHVCESPETIDVAPVTPPTASGVVLVVTAGYADPIWFVELVPQHATVASARIAHANPNPREMCVAPVRMPDPQPPTAHTVASVKPPLPAVPLPS
jgi:hypothetical protein